MKKSNLHSRMNIKQKQSLRMFGYKKYLNQHKTTEVVTMSMAGNMLEVIMLDFMATAHYKQGVKMHTDRTYKRIMEPTKRVLRFFPTTKAFTQGSSEIMKRFKVEFPRMNEEQALLCYTRAYIEFYEKISDDSKEYFKSAINQVRLYEKLAKKLVKREYSHFALVEHYSHLFNELYQKLAHLFDESGEIYPPEKLRTLISEEHYEQLEGKRP